MTDNDPCGDPACLCVYNGCSLAFWSFIAIVVEALLMALAWPFSIPEALVHFTQIVLLLIGLFGLYSGCCYRNLVRLYATLAWPLTALTVLSLAHYSDQLTASELAEALSFYFSGIELVIAYITGAMGLLRGYCR